MKKLKRLVKQRRRLNRQNFHIHSNYLAVSTVEFKPVLMRFNVKKVGV